MPPEACGLALAGANPGSNPDHRSPSVRSVGTMDSVMPPEACGLALAGANPGSNPDHRSPSVRSVGTTDSVMPPEACGLALAGANPGYRSRPSITVGSLGRTDNSSQPIAVSTPSRRAREGADGAPLRSQARGRRRTGSAQSRHAAASAALPERGRRRLSTVPAAPCQPVRLTCIVCRPARSNSRTTEAWEKL